MKLVQRIVHNEAMRNDPPEIYNWRVLALSCSACFGALLFGMDSGTIGGVLTMPTFKEKYGLTGLSKTAAANLSSNIVSTLQAGCFAGALIGIPVADWIGRRPGLMVSAAIAFVGMVLQAASDGHLVCLYFGRFIAGFGTGGASMMAPLYVSESAPRALRGGLTGLYQLFICTGIMLSFWINYGSLLHIHGDAQWAVPLALQGMPPFLLFFSMLFCTESPRHLAKKDLWEASKATLSKIRNLPEGHPYIEDEFNDVVMQLEQERTLIGGATFWNLQREMWLIPGNRKRALITIGLMICQQMTGTNAINYYAPQIFENLGITGNSTGLFATGVYGIVKVTGVSVFLLFVADSLGRRRSLLWTAIGQMLCMFYIGLYVRIKPPVKDAPVPPAGYVALVCIFLFACIYQFGWGPVCWIYVSEIPSARLRSMNVGIAAATQWLFNFVVAKSVPSMLATVGKQGYGTYFIFGCFSFSMFVFTWFFIPETKGLALERMDDLFGVTQLLEKKIEAGEIAPSERGASIDHKTGAGTTNIESIPSERQHEPTQTTTIGEGVGPEKV